ncbi:hypothetical protein M409DRAFT_66947 [Zasmidium cellare ATCC 36951]|uniref:Methyltransferase type 11 domain-containing protein n=1 Tax=Zasmidium cellare ATCC 36951 TaxID=1080233 RepID=A0A6A6CJC8_ZASCE|nr:uncharacterized protein M409DRAFT_66947 [Zasmidium cellare ATCC 36951]KAF2166062.1 hypothetical protein M409DRAFT_66947 [Zasmidium cellare ATCC 36951]
MSSPKQVTTATTTILTTLLSDYPLKIHGGSNILVSDASIALSLYESTAPVRTPYGPTITIAQQQNQSVTKPDFPNVEVVKVDDLKMDEYSHAVFGVQSEDPKFILGGLRFMKYALRPKGYAVVISIKVETKQVDEGQKAEGKAEGDGKFQVGLEDKLKYQSKGKVNSLSEVLEYAGFERGRVRSLEKSADVEGKEVQAEVILAMKWDQLTA